MKKVKLFETFASDCKCGGNCTCGTSKVNEAKKLKYKDIHDAWNLAYGEDFEYEYEGVYQEIVGKHRGKISKDDLAKLWDKMYGEDLATDYSGFFDKLDENLNEKSVYYYQEEVIELVKGLNQEEYEVFAFDNNVESDDADQMMDFIGSLSKKEAKDIIKQLSESVTNEASLSGIEFGNDDDIHPTKFKPLVQSLKKNKVKMEVEKEEGMHGYPEVKLIGKRKDIEKVLADVWGPDSVDGYAEYFEESITNEANADGTISDDEDERRDELEYEIYHKAEELIQYLKDEAENIGGPFRSPGIISDCVKQIKDAFRKNKIRL